MNAVEIVEQILPQVENLPNEIKSYLLEIQILNQEIDKHDQKLRQSDGTLKKQIKTLEKKEINTDSSFKQGVTELSELKQQSEALLKGEPHLLQLYQTIQSEFDETEKKTDRKIEITEKSIDLMEQHIKKMQQELDRIEEMELSGVAVAPLPSSLTEPPPVRKATLTAIKKVVETQSPSLDFI